MDAVDGTNAGKARAAGSEQGIALVVVLIVLVIVCLTLLAASTIVKTQLNAFSTAGATSLAVTRAEDGLALAYARLRAGDSTFQPGRSDFRVTTPDGWTIRVEYLATTPASVRATASRGKFSRTVQADVTEAEEPLPFNAHGFMAGAAMSITNGSYFLNGNSLYAVENLTLSSFSMGGTGSLVSSKTVNVSNGSLASTIKTYSNAVRETIPAPNWDSFAADPSKIYRTYTVNGGTLDISADLMNAGGKIILVRVTGGSPAIKVGANSFSNKNALIVVLKDAAVRGDSAVQPTLTLGNGNYSGQISAFVDGKVNLNSGSFNTSGVLYASGDISLTNGSFRLTGGVVSQSRITVTSVSFGIYQPQWDLYQPYFGGSGSGSGGGSGTRLTRWREP